jgi:hypothetical protein
MTSRSFGALTRAACRAGAAAVGLASLAWSGLAGLGAALAAWVPGALAALAGALKRRPKDGPYKARGFSAAGHRDHSGHAARRAGSGACDAYDRMEVRYRAAGRKYRAVLRPGDPFPDVSPPTGFHPPRGVLSAKLYDPTTARGVDVTARVRKYQGPLGDFHAGQGLRVDARDIFPHDVDENSVLEILDTGCRTHYLILKSTPDLGAALAPAGGCFDALRAFAALPAGPQGSPGAATPPESPR